MCFYNLHMEVACDSTIYIWKLYVFLQLTYGSHIVSTIYIWKLHVFLQITYGSCMCFYNLHMEVECVSSNYIWKLHVFLQFTYGS